MDREALESIARLIDPEWHGVPPIQAEIILETLIDIGYRRLSDKPPVLPDDEARQRIKVRLGKITSFSHHREIQRDADWEYLWKGGKS